MSTKPCLGIKKKCFVVPTGYDANYWSCKSDTKIDQVLTVGIVDSEKQAIRKGRFKAVRRNVTKKPDSPIELYDLDADLGETTDIAAKHPDVVRQMARLFKKARIDSETFPLFGK